MKEIKKEIKSFETMYVANDGTEFSIKEECKKYEESAKGVIFARYNKLKVGESDEWAFMSIGYEDHRIDILKPTCDRDKDTILQMFFFIQGEGDYKNGTEYIERAIKDDDVLFVGWNYDRDYCWVIGTRNSAKERIDKFVQGFTTKDDVEQK